MVLDLDNKSPNDITNTLGSAHGGYFKAREIVQNIVYRELLPMLNAIAENGVAMNFTGQSCWRWSDPYRTTLRIHTKDVGAD
ncbi:MAG: hypothetical protein K8S55_08555 [Phycisphaerae bacterium]|nr:hypothetical protein [Phycisphaerae bacterium]